MQLTVNGKTRQVTATTLADLLAELEYHGGWLATALNGEVVYREDRRLCRLHDGDRIEILSPMQGG